MPTKQASKPRNLLSTVCAILLLVATASGQDPVDVIKVDANLVSVPVVVSDRQDHYLPGLKIADFKLFDNTAEQQIAFFDAAEEPLNVALMLDTSRSTEGVLKKIKKAADNFLKELRKQDRAMVVSFDVAVHHLSPLTSDRKVLEKAIKNAKAPEEIGTVLNDAVLAVLDNDFKSITGRKAMILLTDGWDAGSRLSSPELLADAAESDTMIYSIYYPSSLGGFGKGRGRDRGRDRGRGRGQGGGGRFPGRGRGGPFYQSDYQSGRRPTTDPNSSPQNGQNDPTSGQQSGQDNGGRFPPQGRPGPGQRRGRLGQRGEDGISFLTKLSEETSGRFYNSEVTDLEQSFGFIAEELRYQYRLGFYPQLADGTLHALTVKVDRDDASVRSRRQYRTAMPK
jgi:VWFA-related protein